MPKLLFLVTEDGYFVSHRLPLAMAAVQAGYEVIVVTCVGQYGYLIQEAGLKLIPIRISRGGKNPFLDFMFIIKLILIYRREQPDIVHHVAMKPILYGSLAAKLTGIKCVVNALAGLGWLFTSKRRLAHVLGSMVRLAFKRLLNRGIIIVQNPDDKKWLVDLGVKPTYVYLIRGSGVDVNTFVPTPEPEGIPQVTLVSRMLWDKGVGEFVAAARKLKQRGVAARFVLVGNSDPSNPASISSKLLTAWHQEGVIEWWGHRDDVVQIFNHSHLVCLPSYREGLPKVLLEAAACGRAIIATDVPGCREVVTHGDNGLLVPPRNEIRLADAVQTLLQDSKRRDDMAKRCRDRAVREFTVEKVVNETLSLYREALCGRY